MCPFRTPTSPRSPFRTPSLPPRFRMSTLTGIVVGYDDFLPFGARRYDRHEFHVVVEEVRTVRRVRLRAQSFESTPLRLSHFGESAELSEVRERFVLGALITFEYMEVWDRHRDDQLFHVIDVIVLKPEDIERDYEASLTRGLIIPFPKVWERRV
jgi:hypothetical protein